MSIPFEGKISPLPTEGTLPRSVLVCDDSIEEIRVIVSMLRAANYRLIIAANGKEACDRASVLQPDLILMDVRMPVMDGFTSCRLLKAHRDTKDIPIIFLTAANEMVDRLEGLRLGGCDYIVKPANEEEVLLRVAIHARKRQQDIQEDVLAQDPRSEALVRACIGLLASEEEPSYGIDELAEKLKTSRQRLTEAFRNVMGCSMFAWAREQRLKRACEWLARSDIPISDIATDLGYSTSGNFATAFRERFSITPREFRKVALETPRQFEALLTLGPLDLPSSCNPCAILDRSNSSSS